MGKVVHLPDRGAALTRQEREFLPAALEILETPPSPAHRWTSWTLVTLVGVAVAWASLGKIDITASAPGKLVPVGRVKLVQPLETSVVRAIHVAEGEHVTGGQVLIDLDPTEPAADLESSRTERAQALLDAEAARVILAQDEGASFSVPPEVDAALAAATQVQVALQLKEHAAQIESVKAEIADKRATLAAKENDAAKNAEMVPLAIDRYSTQKELFARGNTSKLNVLQAQYDMIDRKSEQKSIPEQRRALEADIHGLEHKIVESDAQFLGKAADQRVKALQKVAVVDQTLRKERQREALRHLLAPVAGAVQELKTHTAGGVVTVADTLMTIVPDDATLEVEATIEHQDMGFLHEGQDAEIKLDAYPFTRYGTLHGMVRSIARDASASEANGNGSSSGKTNSKDDKQQSTGGYRVLIALDRQALTVEDATVHLMPGMAVQADIKTGQRHVIGFLLDPIMRSAQEAGRER
ncbi:hemolysin D [Rhizobiales bacterium GAS113]|nr:hemolysin D [Rhizobiales bacterium GAS113]